MKDVKNGEGRLRTMTDKEDIRLRDDVIKTYWAMFNPDAKWMHEYEQLKIEATNNDLIEFCRCMKCGVEWTYSTQTGYAPTHNHDCPIPDPIPLSVAELAEFMMRKCDGDKYARHLRLTVPWLDRGSIQEILLATPEQRIKAAVAAWE